MQSNQKEIFKYLNCGLSPIPLVSGKKNPKELGWQDYCSTQPTKEKIEEWSEKYDLDHIGLCLGTEVKPNFFLVAIDVDDDALVNEVTNALMVEEPPAKIGNKGITIFGLADSSVINQKIKRKTSDGKPAKLPSVEILCHGSQTVVPPSIHPSTGKPYTWVHKPLYDNFPDCIPVISPYAIDEIVAICHGKGDKVIALNEMVWLGQDGGGNTHDSCVEAVAWMVSRGWNDQYIHSRIEYAKEKACERNGDKYDWPNSNKSIQEWIDSAREKGMTNSSKQKKRPKERIMSEWAIDLLGGIDNVATVDGILRNYKDGHWPEVNLPWLKRQMFIEDDSLRKSDVENACHILYTLTEREYFGCTAGVEAKHDPKKKRICLLNGTYNVSTRELEKHDRDHEILHQLDFMWDEDATCPSYEMFMQQSLANDPTLIAVMEEFAGLTLVPDTSFQKFLVAKGSGGNGKGTFARILRSMHDSSAIGSVSITALNDERKRTSLSGKLVNISGEQSRLNLVSDEYLKKITGEDPIDTRRLYGETDNNVILSVRFFEMVNEMPQTSDNSDALRRRMIIVPWNNKVSKPDGELQAKLHHERAGIFKRWMEALAILYDRSKFDIPDIVTKEVDEYMKSNNPVQMWFEERCEPTTTGYGTPTGDLYGDYRDWALANGYNKPYTNIYWGQKMSALGYESKVRKIGETSHRIRMVQIKKGLV